MQVLSFRPYQNREDLPKDVPTTTLHKDKHFDTITTTVKVLVNG